MKGLQDKITLSNGYKIPCIGFGTWQIEEGETAVRAVKNALDAGYRHIDTAAQYGNEKSVGRALRESGINRSDVFITSKVQNLDRGYHSTLQALDKTLETMELEYLDLYLIHWPVAKGSGWERKNADTWHALEKIYWEGKAKAIGVCNFNKRHLVPLIEDAQLQPMVNQIELHPGYTQADVCAFCSEHDILIEAWSPLAGGKILGDERLEAIADEYEKSIAQVSIRWCLQNHAVPLPKTTHPEWLSQNANVFDFELSPEDMEYINELPKFGFSGLNPDTLGF